MEQRSMPMTARLAQTLHEKLGAEGAAEMIAWFDDTQRGARFDLHQMNELNYERFDARVGQRFAEFRNALEDRLDEKIRASEAKLTEKIGAVEAKLTEKIRASEANLTEKIGAVEAKL